MTASNTAHNLKVRNVHFNFDKVPKHWILGSSVATHFINSMHIVFPEGEKFFVRSVRHFAKDIKQEELRTEINSFCGQEGVHAREHQRFWEVMEEQNLKPKNFANFLKTTMFAGKYSYEKISTKLLNTISPQLGDKFQLSVTTALEHYTAIIANALFLEPLATNKNIAPQMLELLHWHASEEIEHKAVCFDVLKEVDDSYLLRVSGMGVASILLWSSIATGQVYFIIMDKDKSIIKMPFEIFILFNAIVFGEVGKNLSKHFLDYFKPNFHPNDIDDRYLIEKFFKDKTYA
ncbi:MAG TPA: metal-dependent hydrolase [Chitinophagales bacterium]|nr:metal-dependent hydrolase [Chitinophagales bacterium]HMW13323.1 metal-dependent hydrolase [Chitinophagales bacterium]HMX60498.1 metal-dependent hydrolase [Chitinophagales bacterium]HMY22387.1 metal-dependent hydrolase [Chitinophagales bacterium]HMZ33308.1 metal-dependent hydrolase [Chitinophagales bacterium]